jgi:hypothetical protein
LKKSFLRPLNSLRDILLDETDKFKNNNENNQDKTLMDIQMFIENEKKVSIETILDNIFTL